MIRMEKAKEEQRQGNHPPLPALSPSRVRERIGVCFGVWVRVRVRVRVAVRVGLGLVLGLG